MPSKTSGVWVFMRGYLDKSLPVEQAIPAASKNIRDTLKVYPLSTAKKPPATEFINVSNKDMHMIVPNDYSAFEKLHALIQTEPDDYLGPEAKGMMAAIGIEKGKPFKPDPRMKQILTDAAAIGNGAARAISYFPRDPGNLHLQGQQSLGHCLRQQGHHLHAQWSLSPRPAHSFPLRLYLRIARYGHDRCRQRIGLLHGYARFRR